MRILRDIDTERRSFIPLRIGYLLIAVVVLVGSAILLLGLGFWGVFAFCCVNAPFLLMSIYWKDAKLRRFHDGMTSFCETFWPLG